MTAPPHHVALSDIVQVRPDRNWGACLVIVTELKSWGIQGFTPMPPDGGQAYIRLKWEDIEPTGGKAVYVPGGEENG
jgi:hypothetical protein